MHPAFYLGLLLTSLCFVTHGHHNGHNITGESTHKLYNRIADFAVELYKQLSSASPEENIFFSPVCISSIFSILSLGAKSATHTQILEGLHFNLTETTEKEIHQGFHDGISVLTRSDAEAQLDLGQALFIEEGQKPLPTFLNAASAFYDKEVLNAKFQEPKEAAKQINDYVKKKTHGKIVELVSGLQEDTVLVLVNYILFKGTWAKPFDPEHTEEGDFFVDQETTVKVPMMHRLGWFEYYFDNVLHCTVVEMDYKGTVTAFFVLPDEGKLKEVEEGLSVETMNRWAEHISRHTANVFLPRFNISATVDLKEPLSRLGITDVFTNKADLTEITGKPLKVAKATHKAVLAVDERGTEAAAATAVEAIPMSLPPTILYNRAFLVFLFDMKSNFTLFAGKVSNPART